MELFTELYDADEELYQESLKNSFLVKNDGQWHGIGESKCGACLWTNKKRWPVRCECGGLVHCEQVYPEDEPVYACDKCDGDYKER